MGPYPSSSIGGSGGKALLILELLEFAEVNDDEELFLLELPTKLLRNVVRDFLGFFSESDSFSLLNSAS